MKIALYEYRCSNLGTLMFPPQSDVVAPVPRRCSHSLCETVMLDAFWPNKTLQFSWHDSTSATPHSTRTQAPSNGMPAMPMPMAMPPVPMGPVATWTAVVGWLIGFCWKCSSSELFVDRYPNKHGVSIHVKDILSCLCSIP